MWLPHITAFSSWQKQIIQPSKLLLTTQGEGDVASPLNLITRLCPGVCENNQGVKLDNLLAGKELAPNPHPTNNVPKMNCKPSTKTDNN